jgi:hypothetical protein
MGLPVGMCVEVGQSCGSGSGLAVGNGFIVFHGQSTGCP